MMDPVRAIKQGIAKTNNGLFRIATFSDEFIVVANKEQVAEYLRAPDSVLSMQDGANDVGLLVCSHSAMIAMTDLSR
jgi:hypothetical protein